MAVLKAVIGANYGDEGKGYMTDYLCGNALEDGKSCLVICTNGGAQRGHTVETKDGERFVFHHLGSGSLLGVGTYFCKDFILNPMLFMRDWEEYLALLDARETAQRDKTLSDRGYRPRKNEKLPDLFMDKDCRFSTPYDMMINQIFEDHRGDERHGSVGVGIWETVRRYEKGYGMAMQDFDRLTETGKIQYLQQVRDYGRQRIYEKTGIYPENMAGWREIWVDDGLIRHFMADYSRMLDLVGYLKVQDLAAYDILVAENAQGILLSQDRYDGRNFTTPSDTGAKEIRRLLAAGMDTFVNKTELYYVTRSYITKHGAGAFEEECPMEDINPAITDLTNVPNGYQGTIRYGHLDPEKLGRQIIEDLGDMENYDYDVKLLITHGNEAPVTPVAEGVRRVFEEINQTEIKNESGDPSLVILYSDGCTRASVKAYQKI